jgi:hypothetical protein
MVDEINDTEEEQGYDKNNDEFDETNNFDESLNI